MASIGQSISAVLRLRFGPNFTSTFRQNISKVRKRFAEKHSKDNVTNRRFRSYAFPFLVLAGFCSAQESNAQQSNESLAVKDCFACRFDIEEAVLGSRFLRVGDEHSVSRGNQFQVQLKASVKLDTEGKFTLHQFVQTGDYFSGDWNNSVWGHGNQGSGEVLWQAAYLSYRPNKSWEYQGGMIGMWNGNISEIAGYAGSGGLTGHRLINHSSLGEISVTAGQMSITGDPSVIHRGADFGRMNYQQIQWAGIAGRWSLASSYAHELGFHTLRQSVSARIGKGWLKSVRVDSYERTNRTSGFKQPRGQGALAGADFGIGRRLKWSAGLVTIDRSHPSLNDDAFWRGRRAYGMASFQMVRGTNLFAGWNQALGSRGANPDGRQFFQAGIAYDVASLWR